MKEKFLSNIFNAMCLLYNRCTFDLLTWIREQSHISRNLLKSVDELTSNSDKYNGKYQIVCLLFLIRKYNNNRHLSIVVIGLNMALVTDISCNRLVYNPLCHEFAAIVMF